MIFGNPKGPRTPEEKKEILKGILLFIGGLALILLLENLIVSAFKKIRQGPEKLPTENPSAEPPAP